MTSSSCWQAVSARDSRGKFIDSDSSNDLSSSLSPELVTIHCFEACKSHESFHYILKGKSFSISQIFSENVLVSEIWQAEIYSPPSTVVLGKMGKTQSLWMCNFYSAWAGRCPKEELVSRFYQTLCWQEQWNRQKSHWKKINQLTSVYEKYWGIEKLFWKTLLRFDIKELIECSAAGNTQTGLGRVLRAPLRWKEIKI